MTDYSGMGSSMGVTNPFRHTSYLLSKQMLKCIAPGYTDTG